MEQGCFTQGKDNYGSKTTAGSCQVPIVMGAELAGYDRWTVKLIICNQPSKQSGQCGGLKRDLK